MLLNAVRPCRNIALAVDSSGIVALLLQSGTVQVQDSNFVLRRELNLPFFKQTDFAVLLRRAELIVRDEAPISNWHDYASVDRLFCDLMEPNASFDGKVIGFGGDFRQVLSVIRYAVERSFQRH